MSKSKNNFYVYEWFNVDTGDVFYVGKGRNDRFKNISQRNQYFKNYYSKYNCDVRKVRHSLSEDEAFEIEIELIEKYRRVGQCQCNLTNGGEGCTFPEGSWNYMFRKLQYLHDVKGAMDDMANEDNYSYESLKTKTLQELEELYEEFKTHKEGVRTFNNLVYDKNGEVNDGWEHLAELQIRLDSKCMIEMKYQNEDIWMLTKMIADNIAKNKKEFSEFLKYKTEIDFCCHSIDTDKFIELMLENADYNKELITFVFKSLQLLKVMGKAPQLSLWIKIKSHNIEDNFITIRFCTKEDARTKRVKINLYDLVWGILTFENKPLFQIIYEEIIVAPFI